MPLYIFLATTIIYSQTASKQPMLNVKSPIHINTHYLFLYLTSICVSLKAHVIDCLLLFVTFTHCFNTAPVYTWVYNEITINVF